MQQKRPAERQRKDFTAKEWLDLCERYNYACVACGMVGEDLTADHVPRPIPREN